MLLLIENLKNVEKYCYFTAVTRKSYKILSVPSI